MISISARLKPVVNSLNRFSGWLLLLAVGWLAWTAARLLWLILAPPAAPALPVQALQNNMGSTADNSSLFAIFADPELAAAVTQPPPNVALKGVMLAIPSSLSSALLDVNGEVKNYRIGDELQDSGYTLVAVDWDSAIIADAADKQSVISMADAMPLDQGSMAAGGMSNQRLPEGVPMSSTMPQALALPNALNTNEGVNSVNNPAVNTESPTSAIDEAVEALQQSPASYLSRMGVMAAGEGYQVTAAMPAEVRNRLGLEPGDRVMTVNGQSVGNDPMQDAGVLQQVQQTGEAQIEVKRGDQVVTIRQQF